MNDILNTIAARTVQRVEERKALKPLADVVKEAEAVSPENTEFPFEQALRKERISFICEVRKRRRQKAYWMKSSPISKSPAIMRKRERTQSLC